jgi:ABC-type taurine transport system ATPase subunit
MSARPYVAFSDVCLTFGRGEGAVRALDHVYLGFERGSFVCVVGPSGCGKTTLLNTLAGFEAPTSGRVTVEGEAVRGTGPDRGVVFQQAALFPWMTVAGNATFGPKMRGLGRREQAERAAHWLRKVGLWEFRDRYPYELSGGMQQRLALARALANDPAMLLMDEPFGALDALTRERMQEEMQAVWRESGMTVLFITHGVEEAVFLGTEVVVMSPRPGRIVARFPAPFAREAGRRGSRAVKSDPAFVALREQVLGLILDGHEGRGGAVSEEAAQPVLDPAAA